MYQCTKHDRYLVDIVWVNCSLQSFANCHSCVDGSGHSQHEFKKSNVIKSTRLAG